MLRKLFVAGLVLVAGFAGTAEAQVSRVFVSVNGNDANVCSNIATPCRTLGGGITQVDPEGEVIVIDSGSFAGGTITKSVKIDVAAGAVAFSALPIVVDPGAGGTVVVRGLTLKAATVGSGNGITHVSGALFVENTIFDGWSLGLVTQVAAEQLHVNGAVFRNQVNMGLYVQGGIATVAIDRSFFQRNGLGLRLDGGFGRLSNSVLTGNGSGGAAVIGPGTELTVQRCEVSGNGVGLSANSNGTLRASESTITRNTTGLKNYGSSAVVESYGNNIVASNTTNTSGTIGSATLQ